MIQAASTLDAVRIEVSERSSGVLLRSVVICLTAFLTVVDLFATQAILPTLTRAYNVTPAAMGLAQAINFQSTGGGKAAITGDFVLIASEVNPVIKALRENDIEVTALHSHMLTESPRLFFMHFWANDDALRLARGLRAGLDKVNVRRQ